jgi:myosin heavy subunit
MAWFETGSLVWFDHPVETWSPAHVAAGGRDMVRVEMVQSGEGFTHSAGSGKFKQMNSQNLQAAPDMVKLGDLHEAALLHNIRLRFSQDHIFTYIGPILVACNPYKQLDIFTPAVIYGYSRASAAEVLPPHVYGLANNAYVSMLRDAENQSVVISGESGAGKTEETKLCLQFLAEVASDDSSESGSRRPEQLLLASSPILEAMGNAKTIRNNNSSRFGKYMQILFNSKGKIVGGSIIQYLLEKCRVVSAGAGERNYHLFYLLGHCSQGERQALGYGCADDFRYCRSGGCTTVEGLDDEADLAEFCSAWRTILHDEGAQAAQEVQASERAFPCKIHTVYLYMTYLTGERAL